MTTVTSNVSATSNTTTDAGAGGHSASTGATTATTQSTTNTAATTATNTAPATTTANTESGSANTITQTTQTSTAVDAPKTNDSLLSDVSTKQDAQDQTTQQQTNTTPASYEFTLPETIKVDNQEQFDGLKKAMQESGIPTDKAANFVQYLANERDSIVKNLQDSTYKNQVDIFNKTNEKWVEQVKADPEIGGDKWKDVEKRLGSDIHKYGGNVSELSAALTYTGAGNHPAVIKFVNNMSLEIARLNKLLSEGNQTAVGKPSTAQPKSKAQSLYDNKGV